jgi:hypothetical protein
LGCRNRRHPSGTFKNAAGRKRSFAFAVPHASRHREGARAEPAFLQTPTRRTVLCCGGTNRD